MDSLGAGKLDVCYFFVLWGLQFVVEDGVDSGGI